MLNLHSLDQRTRQLMLEELRLDVEHGALYVSPRLSAQGAQQYPALLREAIACHDDSWLEQQLRQLGLINATETRRKPSGGATTVKVPHTAAQTMAEGEFNRFYIRALCRRAMEDKIASLVVYRAKEVDHPRPESEAKIGTHLSAAALLQDLRTHPGVDTALGLPSGPNSGLSVRLP